MTPTNGFRLRNARVVLENDVVHGCVEIENGQIVSVSESDNSTGIDLAGDYLLPGLIELHTDHLETHYGPRPGVRWNPLAAIQAHDAQIATAGITTVLDCLRMGIDDTSGYETGEMQALAGHLDNAGRQGRLRADHKLHLRCEVSSIDVLDDCEGFSDNENIMLVSLMDHAPGQRQFSDLEVFEKYHREKKGMDKETFKAFSSRRLELSLQYSDKHRQVISDMCKSRNIALASHDDATIEHVADAIRLGIHISEFPTTVEAAKASHEQGMRILMGAPNVVRGQSHSGNVGARELARLGTLDVLSSDYVPASLLHAAFVLAIEEGAMPLHDAVALITCNPARAIGFEDRGVIAEGYRADLIHVRYEDNVPTVKCVWREGVRVA